MRHADFSLNKFLIKIPNDRSRHAGFFFEITIFDLNS